MVFSAQWRNDGFAIPRAPNYCVEGSKFPTMSQLLSSKH